MSILMEHPFLIPILRCGFRSVLFNAVPNGGPAAMVWGVSSGHPSTVERSPTGIPPKWAVATVFILIIGMALGELASAAPTSGGVS